MIQGIPDCRKQKIDHILACCSKWTITWSRSILYCQCLEDCSNGNGEKLWTHLLCRVCLWTDKFIRIWCILKTGNL